MLSMQRLALAATLTVFAPSAVAQSYPVKPIRFVVPYAAGGGADTMARLITGRMSEALKHPVVIDNRGGAGSNIGNEIVARSAPDGHTLLMGAAALAIDMSLYRHLAYHAINDFAPVSLLVSSPNIVVVHPSMPVKSMRELVAFARPTWAAALRLGRKWHNTAFGGGAAQGGNQD